MGTQIRHRCTYRFFFFFDLFLPPLFFGCSGFGAPGAELAAAGPRVETVLSPALGSDFGAVTALVAAATFACKTSTKIMSKPPTRKGSIAKQKRSRCGAIQYLYLLALLSRVRRVKGRVGQVLHPVRCCSDVNRRVVFSCFNRFFDTLRLYVRTSRISALAALWRCRLRQVLNTFSPLGFPRNKLIGSGAALGTLPTSNWRQLAKFYAEVLSE